jgi:hypothetical protein
MLVHDRASGCARRATKYNFKMENVNMLRHMMTILKEKCFIIIYAFNSFFIFGVKKKIHFLYFDHKLVVQILKNVS